MDENLSYSRLIRSGMKHVIEWKWRSREGALGLYTGWLDVSGYPHGNGTWKIEDGSIYDGEWKRGLRNGKCVFDHIYAFGKQKKRPLPLDQFCRGYDVLILVVIVLVTRVCPSLQASRGGRPHTR